MQKIVFESAQLPGNDRLRKEAWIDTLASAIARLNVDPAPGVPFEGALEIVPLHGGAVCAVAATIRNILHATEDVGIDGLDTVVLMLSTNRETLRLSQSGRDIDLAHGEAVLFDQTKSTNLSAATTNMSHVIGIRLPRELMRRQLTDLEDRFFVPGARAVRRAFAGARLCRGAVTHPGSDDLLLARLAMSHLADLIAAAVGPLEAVAAEQSSGQRTARLITIEREIDRSFDDPEFSLTTLARRLGVTARYVQMLLAANETSFIDEVLQRRLHRARAMLASPRHAHMNIIAIAHECGFSTVSHFHRVFRHRFGMTPGDMREQSR